LILASAGIVLAFLVISVIAKEIELTISPITIDAKQILEEVKKRMEANVTPQQVREEIISKAIKGEVKLNITPYLKDLPIFPEVVCPAFMSIKLPYKAYLGEVHSYVMRYIHEKNLTLQEVCKDKAIIESLVREAVEKVNLTRACEALERVGENCNKMKPLACEKIKEATNLCIDGLSRCKLVEKKAEITKELWKKRIEEKEREIKALEEGIKELLEEKAEEKLKELLPKISSPISSPIIEKEEPKLSKIEEVIPKCDVEEHVCERLKENYEKCLEFKEKCAPRCEVIESLAIECKTALADKETLVTKIVDFIWNHCQLIENFTALPAEVEKVENETISKAEIQPVIIVTKPLTPEQEEKIRALVEKLEQIYKDDNWVYRAFIRANKIEDLRELDFVLTVKIDHILRAAQKGAFKKLPELPDFAPQVDKVLPVIESIKAKIGAELQPLVTNIEIEILNHTREIAIKNKEEKARGIGYAILKFLGLQANRERKDAAFLEEKAKNLSKVADNLKEIAKTEERVEIKALILEQVAKLQESIKAIAEKAEAKRKGALGIWSLLGLK
jgi:hypothetical protein